MCQFWHSSFYTNLQRVGYLQDSGLEEVHSRSLLFYVSVLAYMIFLFLFSI